MFCRGGSALLRSPFSLVLCLNHARDRTLCLPNPSMPLHLLSKKSWNVYAPANIERVKRDEAEARRKALEREKNSLEIEADDRLRTLKQDSHRERKSLKRKLIGEDDTDRDIRLALDSAPKSTAMTPADRQNDSIVDSDGHISLIPTPQKEPHIDKEREKDQYTVYLTDATGRDQQSNDTWYTTLQSEPERWGDDNPRKQERVAARLNASDPLAAMKRGVNTLHENEKARKEWMQQRERDLQEVELLAKKHRHEERQRKKRRGNDDDKDSLDDFDLDLGYPKSNGSKQDRNSESHAQRHRHHHRHHNKSHRHRPGNDAMAESDHHSRPSRRKEAERSESSRNTQPV